MIKFQRLITSISLVLFIISLFLPVVAIYDGPSNLFPKEGFGWQALGFGATTISKLQFSWIANLFYFGSLILIQKGISKISLVISLIALFLSLDVFLWPYEIYFGAYIWIASISLLTLIHLLSLKELATRR